MCLFEKANGMTSINFARNQILFSELEDLPGKCQEGHILLITAGLDELSDVEVPEMERVRASTMEPMTARRFLAARRVTRGLFSKILGISPEKIPLNLDANGKPILANEEYYLSIAHSGETVTVAISQSEVGVDLETERKVDISALARRFFSPEEAAFLESNPSPVHFFRLWTCREAASKADGRGLGKLLGQIKVATACNATGEPIHVTIGDEMWNACHWSGPERVHLALAFRKLSTLISWCDLRRESMI
jgi:4'-phosphopantetheinyl transferase